MRSFIICDCILHVFWMDSKFYFEVTIDTLNKSKNLPKQFRKHPHGAKTHFDVSRAPNFLVPWIHDKEHVACWCLHVYCTNMNAICKLYIVYIYIYICIQPTFKFWTMANFTRTKFQLLIGIWMKDFWNCNTKWWLLVWQSSLQISKLMCIFKLL